MDTMRSIVFITVFIVTLLQSTRSSIVAHHADPIRKSHSLQRLDQTHMGLNRRSHPSRLDRHEPSLMIISTSTEGPGPYSGNGRGPGGLHAGFGGGSNGHDTVSVEMMIIEFDEQPPTEKRRVPKMFGSAGPLLIEESPMVNAATEQAIQSSRMAPESQNASRLPEGFGDIQRQLENIEKLKTLGGEGGATLATLLNLMAPSPDKVKNFQARGSSLTTQAAEPQVSFKEPIAAKASESISFTQAPEKQVFLGSDKAFDNKSHHSQL